MQWCVLCRCIRTRTESSVAVFAHDIFFLGKCVISITLLDGYLDQQLYVGFSSDCVEIRGVEYMVGTVCEEHNIEYNLLL